MFPTCDTLGGAAVVLGKHCKTDALAILCALVSAISKRYATSSVNVSSRSQKSQTAQTGPTRTCQKIKPHRSYIMDAAPAPTPSANAAFGLRRRPLGGICTKRWLRGSRDRPCIHDVSPIWPDI